MPKSKKPRPFHLTKVGKNPREHRERLFKSIRDHALKYQHCFVFTVENMRNSYLRAVRREFLDSRFFFGKTKLMATALGQTPATAQVPGIELLTPYLAGPVGLLFTNRDPDAVVAYMARLAPLDFARAGTVASRDFVIPPGVVYSTGGEVPPEHDVPLGHTIEPELRRLGIPTSMVRGQVILGDPNADPSAAGAGYTVCRTGDMLDSRQTRLMKLFSVCSSEFRIRMLAYWTAATEQVTKLRPVDINMEGTQPTAELQESSDYFNR